MGNIIPFNGTGIESKVTDDSLILQYNEFNARVHVALENAENEKEYFFTNWKTVSVSEVTNTLLNSVIRLDFKMTAVCACILSYRYYTATQDGTKDSFAKDVRQFFTINS